MPQVILLGDSIRMGYAPRVREALRGVCDVWDPEANGGDSANVLAHLDAWVLDREPDLVHVNCGLHDLKRPFGATLNQVPLPAYKLNLQTIFTRLHSRPGLKMVWASTTPVNEAWHHAHKDFDRFETDVDTYNAAATEIADHFHVSVNDLHAVVMEAGRDTLLRPDGVHFTDDGSARLAKAVAAAVRTHL